MIVAGIVAVPHGVFGVLSAILLWLYSLIVVVVTLVLQDRGVAKRVHTTLAKAAEVSRKVGSIY